MFVATPKNAMGQVSCFECATCSLYTPQDDDVYIMGGSRRPRRETRMTSSHDMEQSLSAEVESNNTTTDNPLISDGTATSRLGVSLSHWSDFIMYHGGEEFFRDARVCDIYSRIIYPITVKQQLSYCDYLHDQDVRYVGIAEIYVTSSWEDRFIDVWKALKHKLHRTEHYRDVFIFFPLFSYNYHRLGILSKIPNKIFETNNLKLFEQYYSQQIIGNNEESDRNRGIRSTIDDSATAMLNQFLLEGPWILRNTIVHLHPWDKPLAFQRLSVVFDIYATLIMYGNIEFCMTDESSKGLIKAITDNPNTVINALIRSIGCENSVVTSAVLPQLLENTSPIGIIFQHSLENAENQENILQLISNTITFDELNYEILKRLISFIIDLIRKELNDSLTLEEIINIEFHMARAIRRYTPKEALMHTTDSSDMTTTIQSMKKRMKRNSLLSESMIASTLYYCEDNVGKDNFLTLNCIKQIIDFYAIYNNIQISTSTNKLSSTTTAIHETSLFDNSNNTRRRLSTSSMKPIESGSDLASISGGIDIDGDDIKIIDNNNINTNNDGTDENDSDSDDNIDANLQKAQMILIEHCDDYTDRLGLSHPITISCQYYYGDFLLIYTDNYVLAESVIRKNYEIVKHDIKDNNNHDLLHILHNLLRVYRKLKQYDEALEFGELCLKKFRIYYGNEHYNTLTVMIEVAIVNEELNQLEDARDLFKEAYDKGQRSLGILHPFTILTTYCLGMIYSKLSNYDRTQHFLYLFLMHHNVAIHEHDVRIQHAILAIVKTFEYLEEYQKCIDWLHKLMRIYSPSTGSTTETIDMSEASHHLMDESSRESVSSMAGHGGHPLPPTQSSKTSDSPSGKGEKSNRGYSVSTPTSSIGNLEEWFSRDSTCVTSSMNHKGKDKVQVHWHFEDREALNSYCNQEIQKFEKIIVQKSRAFEMHATTSKRKS